MNEFLEKHNYRLYEGEKLVVIRHHNANTGCIHAIFIGIVLSLFAMSIVIYQVGIIALLAVGIYVLEFDRRKKQATRIHLNFGLRKFRFKKGKETISYDFDQVMQIVSTSENIGSYSSANRATTEEYRREINVLFKDGFVMTIFSLISDYKDPEEEVNMLVSWLENAVK